LILEEIKKLPKCKELGQNCRLPFSYWFPLFKIINFHNVRESRSYVVETNKIARRKLLKEGKGDEYKTLVEL